MNRKKYILWLSSFIVMLTFVLFPSESSAKTVSMSDIINNTTIQGSISIYGDRASATTSASTSVPMTVKASYTYGIGGKPITETKTVTASNSGTSRGVVATANPNVHSPTSIRARGNHTWSISGNHWSRTTNVTY